MFFLKNLLLLISILVICFSVWPTKCLISGLPPGKTRNHWHSLLALIYLFIVGYISYTVFFWNDFQGSVDLIVPTIFFFGAIFVFLVCTLSMQTSNDIKKIFQLEYESTTDPLMGINNRRSMEKKLQSEFTRAKRYRHQLALIMIDIDHFKKINDTLGHQVGDVVLKTLAVLISATVRETDIVCRYGGEEILIILPHTGIEDAVTAAESLRVEIENHKIVLEDGSRKGEVVKVTASFGVAANMADVDSMHCLLGHADKALYFAKQEGRNRTASCVDSEEPIIR